MTSNWFEAKIKEFSKLKGYQKPEEYSGALKLDSNENFVINKQFSIDIIEKAKKNSDVRKYPLSGTERLVKELSNYLNVHSSMIGIGNGSDQILDLLLVAFANKKTRILTSDPTFGFFDERCKLYSIPLVKIPFSDEMKLDIGKFIVKSKTADFIYLDSPNNPTGFQFIKKDLTRLINAFNGPIIIDEAYGEFSDYSVVSLVKKYPNLIVVKTLSKAFGLAGLRLGYFVGNRVLVDIFTRIIQYPYPVNTMAIKCGILALQKSKQIADITNFIKNERTRITKNLKNTGAFEVFDSKANFVLFDAKGADRRIHTALVEQGISIRKLGQIGRYSGCLRVTIGTKEMNSKFLLAIRDFLR